jgi:uncharacterized protein (TIGR02271 family)
MAQYVSNEVAKLSGEAVALKDPSQDLRGRDVYDRDGNQLRSVEDLYVDAEEYYVRFLDVASGGFLGIGEKHFLIPVEAVTDANEDRVTIAEDQETVKGAPDVPLNPVIEPGNVQKLDDYYGSQTTATRTSGESEGDELRVQRTEEELRAGTREREAGDVRVTKSVRTDRERAKVPTRREEVKVDRVPVEGEASEADIGDDEVRVPVTEEEVVVEKRPVAKEEVRVRKDVVEDTETVEEDVRREEVDVDDESTGRTR